MKLVTFTWSYTVQMPDSFDEHKPADKATALEDAWCQVHRNDGEITDVQDEPGDETPGE